MPIRLTRIFAAPVAAATLTGAAVVAASPASAETVVPRPDRFTSAWTVSALPEGIVTPQGEEATGQPGASGSFDLLLNSRRDIVCWDMDLTGLQGRIEGPAKSGIVLREAPAGYGGPARLAVPGPTTRSADGRTGSGCAKGPFTTGAVDGSGTDTGDGFRLADIEADPASYAIDVRTTAYPDGALRGQVVQVPLGGLDTGAGGSAGPTAARTAAGALALLGALGAAGTAWRRSRVEA